MLVGLGKASFLKQVRRQEGRCGHVRLEEGNGFLLDGLGKWGGAECKIKYKGLGEGGNEAVLGGGKNRWMTRVAGGSEPEEPGRRGMKLEIREALLL